MPHVYGGPWTELKVDVIRQYLHFYTTALKNQPWHLLYIDAFAGSGSRTVEYPKDQLVGLPDSETFKGSAQIALENDPPFYEYIFIEQNPKRYAELEELTATFRSRRIRCFRNDANVVLKRLAQEIDWKNHRAVVFLDPYNLSVEPDTLRAIQRTEAIDVWFLFAIHDFARQAARDFSAIEQHKLDRLNRMFGTDAWIKDLYKSKPASEQFGLDLGQEPETAAELYRDPGVANMAKWVHSWLREIFPHVAKPLLLPRTGATLFLLFFCVSNPSTGAIGLAMKAANHILKSQ